jgi:hypothetical protein
MAVRARTQLYELGRDRKVLEATVAGCDDANQGKATTMAASNGVGGMTVVMQAERSLGEMQVNRWKNKGRGTLVSAAARVSTQVPIWNGPVG